MRDEERGMRSPECVTVCRTSVSSRHCLTVQETVTDVSLTYLPANGQTTTITIQHYRYGTVAAF